MKKRYKRKRRSNEQLDLEGKVAEAGGEACFGLEASSSGDENENPNVLNQSGIYGSRRSVASRSTNNRSRRFSKKPSSSRSHAPSMGQASTASSTRNPYKSSRFRRSSTMGSSVRSLSKSCSRAVLQKAAVHIVCAIGENLARETCIASLDAGTPVCLQVTKQGNGLTYAETLAYLEMLRPDEVLLNEGRRNSPLARKVLQLYGGSNQDLPAAEGEEGNGENQPSSGPCKTSTVVKFISRSCFDQTKGAEMLRRLARKETYDASLVEEYILLSSSHAVLHYTQQTLGASFSKNCLDISINSGGKNRMAIDRSTLLQLELLTNAKTGKTKNSLISTIDCTKTTVGSRLLRTNLMAPPCRIDTINARLDLVDAFLEDEDFFYAVLEHLQNLPAVDKMLTNIAIIPRKVCKARSGKNEQTPVATSRLASRGVSALVCIKSTLTALPALSTLLHDHLTQLDSGDGHTDGADDAISTVTGRSSLLIGLGGGPAPTAMPRRHHLLRAIIQAMAQPELDEVCEKVSDLFTESTSFSRNANAMRHQECFALKSADNGMMDIIRKAFLANVDDIYKKADEYAEIHGIHVSVRYSTSRGYYVSVPASVASELPNIFIQPAKSGNHIHCTTEEVHSLNIRAQDNVQDLLLMTHERIREVLDFARSKYDALASLSDAVALLDLCHSFADTVTLSKLPWSRPVMSGDFRESIDSNAPGENLGAIMIRNGRYGIDVTDSYLASAAGPQEIVPNDTYATGVNTFTVISGINGSGKSTYLKQIAIIVLLAHCGSYVPAEQASIPVSSLFVFSVSCAYLLAF
jgi:DNA mismatch repair protein MSH4